MDFNPLEMRDSIKQFGEASADTVHKSINTMRSQDEAIRALEALGYKPQEALKVVNKIDDE